MAIVLSAKEPSAAPLRLAGFVLLAMMAAGVLCTAFAQQATRTRASAASAAGYQLSSGLDGPPLVAGTATFYADDFQERVMASGDPFDMNDLSVAAANQWPLGTRLRLRRAPGSPWDSTLTTEQRSEYFGRSIIVTVQDHGDFTHALDLSRAAFAQLGRPSEGVIRLLIEPLGDGKDAPAVTR